MADVQKRKMDDFLKPAAEASKRPRSEEVVVVDDSDVDDQVGLREYLAMEHEDLAEEALRLAERCAVLEADLKLARKAVKTPATAQRVSAVWYESERTPAKIFGLTKSWC